MNSKFRLASLTFVAFFVLSLSLGAIHPVKALTPVSTLYITPNATGPLTLGTTFSVNITGDMIGSSATSGLNGWDLAFSTGDPSFTNLQPVSISTANNLLSPFGTITTLVNCVNAGSGLATGAPGNIGCDIRDGPGVFHTAIGLSAPATPAPISGLLATVTFTVNGASPDTIGILTPCPATQGCDTLSDGSVIPVPHVTLGATIQTSVGDYALTGANPAPLNPGGSSTSTFTVTSLNLFTNTLALKTDVSGFAGTTPLSPTALTVSCGALAPNPLPPGGTSSSTCMFSSKTPGRYVVTANVTDAAVPPTVFHLAPLTVLVGDFSVTGPFSAVNIPVTNIGTGSVTVASLNGFAGTVAITKTVANPDFSINAPNAVAAVGGTAATSIGLANVNGLSGATVSLSDTLPAGPTCSVLPATSPVPATIAFSCTSAAAGTFGVTISATATISGFSVTKTATFAMTFGTLRNFNVIATSPTSANIGDSGTSTISILNPNSGTGTVSLSDTVPAGLTCQPINPTTATVPGAASLSCTSPTAGSFAVTISASNVTFTRTSIASFNFVNVLVASCPASVNVPANGSVPAACTFSSATPGSYFVTATGTFSLAGGSISHSASMTVNIGDFTIATASNQPVVMAAGATSATAQVKVTGLFGWNRQVAFTTTTDVPGLTGNCGAPVVPTPAGVLRTCTLASTTPGAYTLNVTATCGTAQVCAVAVAHSTTVTVRVQDISIQYTGVAQPITLISGGTNSTTFTVSSLPANGAGFAGTINIATAINPLTGLSATCPTSVILTAGTASPQQTCTFNSSTPNTYTVTLNATALIATGQTVKHTITITVIVKPVAVSHATTTVILCHPTTIAVNNSTSCTISVTDTATGPTTPTGILTLTSSGIGSFSTCTLAGTGATATCDTTYTPTVIGTGSHLLTASYGGDFTHGTSSGPTTITVTVRTTTTTVSCHPTTIVVNNSTSCTVRVSDTSPGTAITPSGIVGLTSSGTGTFTTCTLGGTGATATCFSTYTPTSTGSQTLTANYAGDSGHSAAAAATTGITVTVRTTSTTISCHPITIVVNNSTSCTITVVDTSPGTASTPTGTITLATSGTGTFSTCTFTAGSCTVTYTPTVIGTGSHTLTATYNGDLTHGTSQGTAGITVTQRSTTTSVLCTPSPVTLGSPATCTATVQDMSPGTAITPSGTVAFTTNATAGSFTLVGSPCTLGGSGATAACQVTYTPTGAAPRHDQITGTYSGDTNHPTSQGQFLLAVTAQAAHATTTTISCHPTTIVVNNSTSCTVTVTDISGTPTTPTGTVSLSTSGTGTFTTCSLSGTGTSVTCQTTYMPTVVGTGSHTLTANYPGDSQVPPHANSTGQTVVTVTLRTTSTTISCHPTTIVVNNSTGCAVTITDISPGTAITPSGTIGLGSTGTGTFTTCTLGGTGAVATCSTIYNPTVIGTGSHTLTATFNGDTNHSSSSGNAVITVAVRTTTTTVVCAPSPVTVNSPTTCTVTVKDTSLGTLITPGGTVSLASNGAGTFTGTCTLSGSAGTATCQETYTPSGTAPRTDTITATFPGDSTHSGSQGTFQLPVNPVAGHQTTTTIACHPTTIVVNNVTSCLVTVTDISTTGPTTPSGTVSISTSGTGTFSQACILSGTGASATCSFNYTPTVVGTGSHTLTANYPGDSQTPAHGASQGTTNITVTVRTTTTTITCHPTTIVVNNSTSCTVTVTDTSPGTASTPTGTISLSSSGTGTFSTCTFTAGSCTVTYTPTVIGTGSHVLTANYSGDSTHGTSQGTATIAVMQRSTTTTVTCAQSSVAVGSSTTCTATVQDASSGTPITPSGTVVFTSNSTVGSFTFTGSPCNLSGTGSTATCQVTYGTSGTTARHDLITDTYSSDTNHTTSQGTFTLVVSAQAVHATATTISCHPTMIVVNNVTSCTATVMDIATTSPTTPTGTVTFTSNGVGTFTGTCTLTGATSSASCMMSVSYTPTAQGTGTQAITGTYIGDVTHSSSQGTTSVTVNKRATSTIVNCAPAIVVINQPSTCAATVADASTAGTPITPGGTVTFASSGGAGSFSSTTCTLIGGKCSVSFTPSTTTISNISASYGGDATHSGSSAAIAATVTGSPPSQKDFTLSVSPANLTLVEDSLGRAFVILQSNGFNGTVDLSLKISPTGQGLTANLVRVHVRLGPDSMQRILLIVSGDEANAGDFTVTVTGTSGSLSHSASLTVTVTHPGDDEQGSLGQLFSWFLLQVSSTRWD